MVLRYLHAEVVPALVDARADADSGELFAAAAAVVTDIAGWMAHDGGQDPVARVHFSRAYRFATAAGSEPLAANVCASMSHLAGQLGQPADAVRIAPTVNLTYSAHQMGVLPPSMIVAVTAVIVGRQGTHRHLTARVAPLLADRGQMTTLSGV